MAVPGSCGGRACNELTSGGSVLLPTDSAGRVTPPGVLRCLLTWARSASVWAWFVDGGAAAGCASLLGPNMQRAVPPSIMVVALAAGHVAHMRSLASLVVSLLLVFVLGRGCASCVRQQQCIVAAEGDFGVGRDICLAGAFTWGHEGSAPAAATVAATCLCVFREHSSWCTWLACAACDILSYSCHVVVLQCVLRAAFLSCNALHVTV